MNDRITPLIHQLQETFTAKNTAHAAELAKRDRELAALAGAESQPGNCPDCGGDGRVADAP